jgi:hypothetical protein
MTLMNKVRLIKVDSFVYAPSNPTVRASYSQNIIISDRISLVLDKVKIYRFSQTIKENREVDCSKKSLVFNSDRSKKSCRKINLFVNQRMKRWILQEYAPEESYISTKRLKRSKKRIQRLKR